MANDRTIRQRTLVLLDTFILTPRELASALDISTEHANMTLQRLYARGLCQRWPAGARRYRYAGAYDRTAAH
jgi:predicted transcriptional regulator